jgi:hypothetical protein
MFARSEKLDYRHDVSVCVKLPDRQRDRERERERTREREREKQAISELDRACNSMFARSEKLDYRHDVIINKKEPRQREEWQRTARETRE